MNVLRKTFLSTIFSFLLLLGLNSIVYAADIEEIIPGQLITGEVTGYSEKQYSFIMPEDGYVDCYISCSLRENLEQMKLEVVDISGKTYFSKIILRSGEIKFGTMGFYKDTKLFFKVSNIYDIAGKAINTFSISMNYENTNDWEKETNDYIDDSNTLNANQVSYGNLYIKDDIDYYHFTQDTDGFITLNLSKYSSDTTYNNGWDLYIYDDQDIIFKAEKVLSTYKNKIYLTEGDYYIKIFSNNLSYAPIFIQYRLQVNFSLADLSKVKIINVISEKTGQFNIEWKRVEDASGYELQYSTNNTFKNPKSYNVSKTKKLVNNLKSGSKYYVRVRPYIKDQNGILIYGSYNAAKTIKVK